MSGTQTLRRLVRLDVAKELTFTGRIVVGAAKPRRSAWSTRVADDPRAAALALAREIAGKSPDAIRAGKQLLDQSVQLSVSERLRLEEQLQRNLIGAANQVEAVHGEHAEARRRSSAIRC